MMMIFLLCGKVGLEAMIMGNVVDIPDIIVPNECFNVSAHTMTMEADNEMLDQQ